MSNKKFQLPTLSPLNLSLTEGTNIPPPQASPDEPRPPTPGRGPLSSHPTTPSAANFPGNSYFGADANGAQNNQKEAATPAPINTTTTTADAAQVNSPVASTKRPSSVRRFLGLRSLSSSDSLRTSDSNKRPASPRTIDSRASATISGNPMGPPLSRKKSSGWFGKRKSVMLNGELKEGAIAEEKENQSTPVVPKGPPPPTIPEFKALGSELDGGDLGADDLFRNIK